MVDPEGWNLKEFIDFVERTLNSLDQALLNSP
jgi:hypothetical protein